MNFFSYFYNFFNDITALSVASLSLWHVCNSLIQDEVEENEGNVGDGGFLHSVAMRVDNINNNT